MMTRRATPVLVALVVLLFAPTPGSAGLIQIGSFSWEVVTDPDPDFADLCGSVDPCARFTVTNDLGLLSASELSQLTLTGLEDFENAEITEGPEVLGSIASGASAIATLVWGHPTASLFFELPALTGTLLLPSLAGPTIDGPAPINVNVAVSEPAVLGVFLIGFGSACMGRSRRRRRAASSA